MSQPLNGVEIPIRFLAVKGTRQMVQQPAFCATVLTIAGEPNAAALRIVGVSLNGAPLKFRSLDAMTVSVSPPIPFEAGRVEILCLGPYEAPKAAKQPEGTYAPPGMSYGLQAPETPASKAIQ